MLTDFGIKQVHKKGSIEVLSGSMFSGKTEELIRRLKRAILANQKVEVFKPIMDNRYSNNKVVSHDENNMNSKLVESAVDILDLGLKAEVVGIDEAQFFDDSLPDVCNKLANQGVRVIVAGLDMDYQGKPFGSMPKLLAIADHIVKVHAICIECGALALFTHRKMADDRKIILGEKDIYEPLCRTCFNNKNK